MSRQIVCEIMGIQGKRIDLGVVSLPLAHGHFELVQSGEDDKISGASASTCMVGKTSNVAMAPPLLGSIHFPVQWSPPKNYNLKLNFDGSSINNLAASSCGGVFRDWKGQILLAYAKDLGPGNALVAEFEGLRLGLTLAVERNWGNLSVEGDCQGVITMLCKGSYPPGLGMQDSELRQFYSWRDVHLPNMDANFVYREGNRVADYLCKYIRGKRQMIWTASKVLGRAISLSQRDFSGPPYIRKKYVSKVAPMANLD